MTRLDEIRERLAESDIRGEPLWHEQGCPAVPPAVGDCVCARRDLEHVVAMVDGRLFA